MVVFVAIHSSSYHILFFFFNDTATTEIYTLSLHDALPISPAPPRRGSPDPTRSPRPAFWGAASPRAGPRSEEHTSELQSPCNLVCRLLLEKKKTKIRSRIVEPFTIWTAPTGMLRLRRCRTI